MKKHVALALALSAGLTLASAAAAHDPALHADAAPTASTPKAKPVTCEQLADRSKFKVDLNDAQTKALKDRCDAQAASGTAKKK